MRRLLLISLVAALLVSGQPGGSLVARADDSTTFGATIWAPYVGVDDTAIEIMNNGDAPTWPRITVTLRSDHTGVMCHAGLCTYEIQAPEIDPGDSWTLQLADRACSTGLNENVCLPDGSVGGAQIDAAIIVGTGANAGATIVDPTGNIAAVVTTSLGPYDAVAQAPEATLTDVARGVDGVSTAIQLMGAGTAVVDWYEGDELVVEQWLGMGAYCCGEAGWTYTAAETIDASAVDGLEDGLTYTVVITAPYGTPFAAVTTDAP